MQTQIKCPHCHKTYTGYRNPTPTTDVIIYDPDSGIVLVKRKNIPLGYALPGGFVDEGEQIEAAAKREMLEETSLEVDLLGVLGVYSKPDRDPRQHTVSVVFVGKPSDKDKLKAGDDAQEANFYKLNALPDPIVFDHKQIIDDFKDYLACKRSLANIEPIKQ